MQKPVVNVMVKAARAAGNLILRHMGKLDALNVVEKARQDYASEVDAAAEAVLDCSDSARPSAPRHSGTWTWFAASCAGGACSRLSVTVCAARPSSDWPTATSGNNSSGNVGSKRRMMIWIRPPENG